MKHKITLEQARHVLEVVDAGLCHGKGKPVLGQMCVEAAVTFALGETFSDNPSCVAPTVRSFKIALNDKNWSSNAARAKGLRRIAVAQLGTKDAIDEKLFVKYLAEETIKQIVPVALRAAAKLQKDPKHKIALEDAAILCEKEGTKEAAQKARAAADYAAASAAKAAAAAAAYAAAAAAASAYAAAVAAASAYAAAYAAAAAEAAAKESAKKKARDKVLSIAAEVGVATLRRVGAAGIKFMDILCPL